MLLETLHNSAVLLMTGVIWMIQLLIYPSFFNTDPAHWHRVHSRHTRTMGIVAFPLMVTQLITSGLLCFHTQNPKHIAFFAAAAVLWLLTMILFVPLHNRIARRPLRGELDKLVGLNWIRTAIWTLLSIFIIAKPLGSSETKWLPPTPQQQSAADQAEEY